MLLFLKSGTQQINMPAVYSSWKLNLNSQPEAEGNKIHSFNMATYENILFYYYELFRGMSNTQLKNDML